jgi:hypothetical protein
MLLSGVALLLTLTFFPIEKFFTHLHYWKYQLEPHALVYFFMYIYYILVVAPTCLLHYLLQRRKTS